MLKTQRDAMKARKEKRRQQDEEEIARRVFRVESELRELKNRVRAIDGIGEEEVRTA